MKYDYLNRISEIIKSADTAEIEKGRRIQPTLIYNEGWMLRLVLDWFESHDNDWIKKKESRINKDELKPVLELHKNLKKQDTSWFSEAEVESPFLVGTGREGYTHADAVFGTVKLETGTKGKVVPIRDANPKQLVIVEAKMYSNFSSGVKNCPGYNQIARNYACLSWISFKYNIPPENCFLYIFLPKSQNEKISEGSKKNKNAQKENIFNKVVIRGAVNERSKNFAFPTESDKSQYDNWQGFWEDEKNAPALEVINWETILAYINEPNLIKFYIKCIENNRPEQKTKKLKDYIEEVKKISRN
ncbi:hypothetical protein AGMMS49983_15460 [Clostridia bacterium]|nr:hypothetical protein AGMMS49983_15460 [Clostridia bacterium]